MPTPSLRSDRREGGEWGGRVLAGKERREGVKFPVEKIYRDFNLKDRACNPGKGKGRGIEILRFISQIPKGNGIHDLGGGKGGQIASKQNHEGVFPSKLWGGAMSQRGKERKRLKIGGFHLRWAGAHRQRSTV